MSRRKRFRFAGCQHLGKGAECHRCEAAGVMERRAAELAAGVDTRRPPAWLVTCNEADGQVVRANCPATSVSLAPRQFRTTDALLERMAELLRAEAVRLRAPATKRARRAHAKAHDSLAASVADGAAT